MRGSGVGAILTVDHLDGGNELLAAKWFDSRKIQDGIFPHLDFQAINKLIFF
jgi:hypothetical protein